MEAWHFTEMPYPYLPPAETLSSYRVNIPSKLFDPKLGAELYNRYLDEHMIADDLGLNMMLNEHHQTAYGLMPAPNLIAAALARSTKRAKIAILGRALPLVSNPVAVADEFAMLDHVFLFRGLNKLWKDGGLMYAPPLR